MADIETNILLKADSTEAVKNIKDLKENVEVYKEELLKLHTGTEAYQETLQKLGETQRRINDINGIAASALESLAEATSELTNDAEAYLDGLSHLHTGTEEYVEVLSDLGEAQENVNGINTAGGTTLVNLIERTSELRSEMESYMDELFLLYIGTEEYIEVLSDLEKSLGNVNEVHTEAEAVLGNLIEKISELRSEIERYTDELFILYTGTAEYIEVLSDLEETQNGVNAINIEAEMAVMDLIQRISELKSEVAGYIKDLSLLRAGTEEYISVLLDLGTAMELVNEANTNADGILLNLIGGISGLRSEIESHNEKLSILYITTETYIEVLLNLEEAQGNVNAVNTEAEIALQNLMDELIELTAELITYTDELFNLCAETEEYNGKLLELIEAQEKMNAANADAHAEFLKLIDELGQLIGDLGAYYDELTNARTGTEEYEEALQNLTATQNEVESLTQKIVGTTKDAGDAYSQLTNIAGTVADGLGAVSKITEMLGGDNEFLADTLGKVQAGLALTQQLTAVMKGIKAANLAFKAFNTTLYSNPILAVAAAAAVLVAGLAVLFTALGKNEKQTKELNKAQEDYNKTMEETNQKNDRDLKLAKVRGAKTEELIELERKQNEAKREQTKELIQQYESYKKLNKEQKKNLENLKKELELYDKVDYDLDTREMEEEEKKKREAREEKEAEAKRAAAAEERRIEEENAKKLAAQQDYNERERLAAARHAEMLEEMKKEEQKRLTAALTDEERLSLLQKEIEKNENFQASLLEAANNEKLSWQEREKAAREYQQALIDNQTLTADLATLQQEISDKEAEAEERRIEEARQKKEAEELEEKQLTRINELKEESRLIEEKKEEQKKVSHDNERERYEEELAQSEEKLERHNKDLAELETKLANEKLSNAERIALLEEYNQALAKQAQLEEKVAGAKKKLSEYDLKVKEENHKATIGFLDDAASKLGENTIAGKALGVASATISTYTGAAQVLADPTTPNPFMKWANFAATIATGLSAVKNIVSTDVPGTADNVSAESSSSVSLPSFPEMSTDFVETHNNIDAYDEEVFSQQPVLVVEDVNSVQNRVRVAEGEATF